MCKEQFISVVNTVCVSEIIYTHHFGCKKQTQGIKNINKQVINWLLKKLYVVSFDGRNQILCIYKKVRNKQVINWLLKKLYVVSFDGRNQILWIHKKVRKLIWAVLLFYAHLYCNPRYNLVSLKKKITHLFLFFTYFDTPLQVLDNPYCIQNNCSLRFVFSSSPNDGCIIFVTRTVPCHN